MEQLSDVNKRLQEHFGRFEDGRPRWRIVWAPDELEKRWFNSTPEGLMLLQKEVREVKKYGWVGDFYVLERLVPVIDDEVVGTTSYEPVWVFRTDFGEPIAPVFHYIKVLIDTVYEEMNRPRGQVKYVMPELEKNTPEALAERARILEGQLYGNETSVGDALKQDSGVGFGVRQRNDSKFKKVN